MRYLNILYLEYKHLFRNRFKLLALVLFIGACIYGMYMGKSLYDKHQKEITKLDQKVGENKSEMISYFDRGLKGPPEKSWIDVRKPSWAVWLIETYKYKSPSPFIIYSVGQAEQYGFYKKVTTYSSPYDADMVEEIANPERLTSGTLDFSFVMLFLMPLLLIILMYDVKVAEQEQRFLELIYVQAGGKNLWLLSRICFYGILLAILIFLIMLLGALFTNVLSDLATFLRIYLLFVVYMWAWILFYFFIIRSSSSITSNTLKMVGLWILFTFIIPASVQLWVSIQMPADMMIDIIDVKRDVTNELYALDPSIVDHNLFQLYPSLRNMEINNDPALLASARSNSMEAMTNYVMKEASMVLKEDNELRNLLITNSYWINPVSYFQNTLASLSETSYDDYQNYRDSIQKNVDERIKLMLEDMWGQKLVDRNRLLEYYEIFNK